MFFLKCLFIFNFFLRRCDEWYHTQCVDMPELEVDLVDQFICPPCIESAYFCSLHLPSLIYLQKTPILTCVPPTNNDVSMVSYTLILTLPKHVIKLLVVPFRNIVQTHAVSNICSPGLIHGRRRVERKMKCGRV